jgi:hypothetical protein
MAPNAMTGPSRRMPFSQPACECMGMSDATANSIISKTGVYTPVSLFVVIALLCLCILLLLPGLVVLISLVLIGLTGLIRLESLVGLVTRLATTAP